MDEKENPDDKAKNPETAASEGTLINAAKAVGSVVGKAAALVGADTPVETEKIEPNKPEPKQEEEKELPKTEIRKDTKKAGSKKAAATKTPAGKPAAPPKEGIYEAEYVGSGTFKISKPKRKKAKQRQSALKAPRRGARK